MNMFQERIESKRRRNRLVGLIALFGAAFCLYFCLSFPQTTIPTDESTSSLYSSLRSYIRHGDAHSLVKRSTEFPSLDVSTEMARLSGMIYRFKHYNDCNATDMHGNPLLPPDLDCHFYHHDVSQGTQVMVLSSVSKKYIGVVYAGTDDFRTTLTDTDILLKPFGPLDDNAESILLPGDARVHAGFDNAVFQHNLFDILLNVTTSLVQQYPKHRLFCTGHSLGGANAILTAVALTQSKIPTTITVINFGCPAVGNEAWRTAIHALSNVNIWRFVHGWDMVPRLPEYPFTHVGHTLQMNEDAMRAYYLHRGNASLGYASVPYGWSAKPFIFIPGALWSHSMRHYLEYLNMSAIDPSHYYVSEFEAVNSTNPSNDDDDGMVDDDKWINPPDDEVYPQEEEEIVTLTFDENVVVVQDEEVVVVVDVQ